MNHGMTMNPWKIAIVVSAAALVLAGAAWAQVDSGNKIGLYENGTKVGEVFVPERSPGQTRYMEHWVLSPNYQYPGPKFIGALEIVPSVTERPYADEADFFANAPWTAGSKYVRITSEEFTSLPGRR